MTTKPEQIERPLSNYSPRLVISAPSGRSGKTLVSMGVCAALTKRGVGVQPFKKGPDYIDPSWLTIASERPCRNLDLFMMGEQGVLKTFQQGQQEADISIIEGAMGFYDGLDLQGSTSTAEIARLLKSPVILVIDATRASRSVAAVVQGFQNFEPDINIAGIVLNRVKRPRHEKKMRDAIEHYCKIPVVGALPYNAELTIPQRHLGLTPQQENDELNTVVEAARLMMEEHVDLDALLELAKTAPALAPIKVETPTGTPKVRIGVAMDRAFSFYYPANLEALQIEGAEIVAFDTLKDRTLPEVDALYIGGGFPEVFLDELEANRNLRQKIRRAIKDGMPVYAECGGLMYLARSIIWNDKKARMVSALPCDIEMMKKPRAHGYVTLKVHGDNSWFKDGLEFRGHEFHHSRVINLGNVQLAYQISRGHGVDPENNRDGIVHKNVFASYAHLHTLGSPEWAKSFVAKAEEYNRKKNPTITLNVRKKKETEEVWRCPGFSGMEELCIHNCNRCAWGDMMRNTG